MKVTIRKTALLGAAAIMAVSAARAEAKGRSRILHSFAGGFRIPMRLVAIAAFAGLLATQAVGNGSQDTIKSCTAAWSLLNPGFKAATSYKAYMATCLANAPKRRPPGATALCMDGTYSTSKTASGRCSGNDGVAKVP